MKAASVFDQILKYISILLFASLLIVVIIQIMDRYLPYSAVWTEELSRYLFVYAISFAAPLAIRKNEFIQVDLLINSLSEKWKRLYQSVIYLLVAAFSSVLFIEGIRFYQLGEEFAAPALDIPMNYVYASVPLLAVFLFIYSIIFIVDQFTKRMSEGDPS
ncbi:TRAP transporter small permease [Salicibibacter halophilus]|uniref:TRAP transporter small permease n=1 Tax=Salicibibacter halophilus TaxID=2502791 RepID=A0A514LJS1_9BACI|nr:TRAP transporter small permease [Salicibibacter halophilus]QDI92106.1 TRAP transporter small permease [Salicibibacter halophilus]